MTKSIVTLLYQLSYSITYCLDIEYVFILGAVHILRNTWWGGGGFPDLLQYYIGGGLPNLLQYYNRGGGVYRDPKFVLRNKWTAP